VAIATDSEAGAAGPPRRRIRYRRWKEHLASVAVLIVLVALLQLLLPAFHVPRYVFPTPGSVAAALGADLGSVKFWANAASTLIEVLLGCVIGAAIGFGLGVVLTQSSFLDAVVTPYVIALQAVPKVALAPVIVVALGYGLPSKVAIAAIVAFFPLLVNVMVGIREADEGQLELMRALRASRLQVLRHVQLPGALPTILGGLEVAVVFSVVGAIVGEFTGASSGLGYLIDQRSFSLNQAGVFSTLIVLSAMGLALDLLVRRLGRVLVRWKRVDDAVGM
jgi:NitT/TauT family transport system permease protein